METKTYKVWVSDGNKAWIQLETESLNAARNESADWNGKGLLAWVG